MVIMERPVNKWEVTCPVLSILLGDAWLILAMTVFSDDFGDLDWLRLTTLFLAATLVMSGMVFAFVLWIRAKSNGWAEKSVGGIPCQFCGMQFSTPEELSRHEVACVRGPHVVQPIGGAVQVVGHPIRGEPPQEVLDSLVLLPADGMPPQFVQGQIEAAEVAAIEQQQQDESQGRDQNQNQDQDQRADLQQQEQPPSQQSPQQQQQEQLQQGRPPAAPFIEPPPLPPEQAEGWEARTDRTDRTSEPEPELVEAAAVLVLDTRV